MPRVPEAGAITKDLLLLHLERLLAQPPAFSRETRSLKAAVTNDSGGLGQMTSDWKIS
jgi:hypothetical protein